MLRTTNTFSKKGCLETTYNYSAPQTLNMIERLSAEWPRGRDAQTPPHVRSQRQIPPQPCALRLGELVAGAKLSV